MTLTISLPPDEETQLKERAQAAGQDVAGFVEQLIAEELAAPPSRDPADRDRRLRAAALAAKHLYEPGGELTEWNALDGEEILDGTNPTLR